MLYVLPNAETISLQVFLSLLVFSLSFPTKSFGTLKKLSLDWAGLSGGGGDTNIQLKPLSLPFVGLGTPHHVG